ncbi:MAG: DUF1292 domain-containing protein [Lachnospiraceae bacterium]|nr:DUF1292 domain-containing protein [Lachnospiraceae bacterium]
MIPEKNRLADEDFEAQVITLEFEDNSESECALIAIFDGVIGYEDTMYAALLPVNEEEREDGELYLYRYQELSEDEFNIEGIETESEFDAASVRFNELLDEQEIEAFDVSSDE